MFTASENRRILAGIVAIALAGLVVAGTAAPASADPVTPPLPETVSADVLPTPQINGVVWSVATVGTTAYAVGSFTKARPYGSAAGVGEVTRNNAMAFNVTTGAILPWNPNLNAQGRSVEVSPDGTEFYVGGDFSAVGGQARSKIASFSASTGAFNPAFAPSVAGSVLGMAITSSRVYVGGSFASASGQPRSNTAAFARSNGAITPWAPQTSDMVHAVVAAPDNSRVVIGGRFQQLNGSPIVGIGAVDGNTGATQPFSTPIIPTAQGANRSWVTDLIVQDGVIYGSANGEGGNWFDGRFAAQFATGDLVWLDNCYGATYGVTVMGSVLYHVSHSHDCRSVNTFPQQNPTIWKRALADTIYATGTDSSPASSNSQISHQPIPTQLPWYPLVNAGSYTGQSQGGWSVATSGKYLVMGGEFTSVNSKAQQGLAVFATRDIAPNKVAPIYTTALKPTVTSVSAGAARIAFTGTTDYDDPVLSYAILRDNGTTPIHTIEANSPWWAPPQLGFVDTGLAPGSSHSYRIQVSDPAGNNYIGPRSDPVTVSSATPSAYAQQITADGASSYWPLDESSGTVVYDHAGFADADAGAGVTRGTSGAITGNTASTFPGTSTGIVSTRAPIAGPNVFTLEAWVKTTSTRGGKIIGFGDAKTGNSSSYDRHVYMDGSGRITFGVYPGGVRTVSSAPGLNNGAWHLVTASLGSGGMVLYIDGVRVARDAAVTTAQDYSGYWRLGGDNLSSWPNTGSSSQFSGAIDDVAVYPTALTASAVLSHYTASGRQSTAPAAPTDSYGKSVYADEPDIYWRLNDSSGQAADASLSANAGIPSGGVTRSQPGALPGPTGTAYRFNGQNGMVAASSGTNDPTVYSVETWFRTTTTTGGKLIGFGNSQTGTSSNYDRHIYMQDDGTVAFGTWTDSSNLAISPQSYNDGQWHYVVGTQGPAGMALYLDGVEVASNPQTGAQDYSGYWRIGGDNTWSSTSPYFDGWLDEAAVYSTALSPARVLAHYRAGGGAVPNVAPTASFTASATGATAAFDASASSDSDGSIAGYAWNFGDSATGTGATPDHVYTASGSYTVTLTVTDDGGAAGTVSHPIDIVVPPVETAYARDDFERTVANGFGSAEVGGAWTSSNAASNFSVSGGVGRIRMAAPSSGPSIWLSSVSSASTELRVDVASDQVTTGGGAYISAIGRSVVGQGDYRVKVAFRSDRTVSIALLRAAPDGTTTVLGTETVVSGLLYTAGQPLTVRLQVTGTAPTTLNAKVWISGAAEPASWQKTATDTTAALQTAGRIGFYSYLSGSATAVPVTTLWDKLWAGAPQ